jgi:dihydroneopterin aldolase
METTIINFKVTPSQKETIDKRAIENGFDNVSAYVKVVALKTEAFTYTSAGSSSEEATIEIEFSVTSSQQTTLEDKMKASGAKDLETYLQYVALHAVISSVIEIRSTGTLDDMLQRIADSKKK